MNIEQSFLQRVKNGVEDGANYFRVSMHLVVADILAGSVGGMASYLVLYGDGTNNGFFIPAAGISTMIVIMDRFKSFDNWMKYKDMRNFLRINNWDSRALDPYQYQYCTRNAVNIAAKDEGYAWQLENYHFLRKQRIEKL